METKDIITRSLAALITERLYAAGYFWRTTQQQEIDYIEERGSRMYAYEFKWSTQKKARRFPKTFLDNYKGVATRIVTRENYEEFLAEEL
ncbi:MAG TPA: hypothetical protein DDY20_08970 [Desulfobulbaceae bacterium]|nr:hypothetical protein [Desulfobulbaceae bacterium]